MLTYNMVRYLLAKQPIDDRALNRQVLEALAGELHAMARPPRVLELGAGVGTMVSRLADWGVLERAEYTLIDRDAESLRAARQHLSDWGTITRSDVNGIRVEKGESAFDVRFVRGDLFSFLDGEEARAHFDLVFANAVLDLFDLEPTLPRIWQVLRPGGAYWFTINFDGETLFMPELPLDQAVMAGYHATMTRDAAGTRAGHSQTGRRLLTALPASGASLLAAGGSDWVVFPRSGAYPGDEAYFLHHIVDTIHGALVAHGSIEPAQLSSWVEARHAQIERAQLSYIAHQLDVFGSVP
jgi:SAM-dependent methyltransferase